MAANSFKGIGWFCSGVVVALGCYLVTSAVAGEHAKLERVDKAIVTARNDLRSLQTEFDTRANLPQLERWNGEVLALQAPRPEQLVSQETALASLDQRQPIGATVTPAVIPATGQASPAPSRGDVQMADATDAMQRARQAASALRETPARTQAVAMLDRKLLSDSTLTELVRSARSETGALR